MATREHKPAPDAGDPLWFKDAVIYQVHVRAFYDSDGDGIGDFKGLAEKLDYVHELGVDALWLLPFYPSPLRDDGYDIADYGDVHPAYGTLADFKHFLREAHRRDLKVITELVLNHTSDQHPWFQRARRAPAGSSHRNFYVWSDTTDRYRDARIIFKDFEQSNWSWDPVAGAYYWHRFYSHQPDLNFENPAVRKAVTRALDFWMDMGVDGLRLDAVPYLHEQEGTSCENLPATHQELKLLRRHVDKRHRSRMLLAEANQWPEDAVAYFGEGDECHMAFHFPLMPRMFMAVRMEDRYPIIDILSQTPAIPDHCQWALFLRNHDELTLEMVTDEERDYMYRVYATDPQARINLGIRRRLAPLLGNNRRRIELMNGLLLSLPGTPVVYYGDEIGMGDNIFLGDRNGVRTPMQWSADRNAGFSRANAQRLYLPVNIDPAFSYEALNVEAQHDNPHSLLWWMRRLIGLRRRFKALSRGSLEFLYPANRKVLAFVRRHEEERVLVVVNLSRFAQYVELDLAGYREWTPREAFGGTPFPPIGDVPYRLTLGPHEFFWFALEAPRAAAPEVATDADEREHAAIEVDGDWDKVLEGRGRDALERALPSFLRTRRWFGGKARGMTGTTLLDAVPIPYPDCPSFLAFVQVEYTEGDPDVYAIGIAYADGDKAARLRAEQPHAVIADLAVDGRDGLLYSATVDPAFGTGLVDAMARRRSFRGEAGVLVGAHTKDFRQVAGPLRELPTPQAVTAEQSNTSLRFGDRLMLKLFRRVEQGVNPDLEISTYLTTRGGFAQTPAAAGWLEYRTRRGQPVTVALLQQFIPNEGDAWEFTLDAVGRFFERTLARPVEQRVPPVPPGHLLDLAERPVPQDLLELIGTYLESARLLGRRTAELHRALASNTGPDFAPEPFTPFYQRSLYQSMRNLTEDVFDRLERASAGFAEPLRAEAERVALLRPRVLGAFRAILDRKLTAARTRLHGDFHLGQVLCAGRDFVIIDFEGEPSRPLSARRLKRSPLRDVAGMIRSFHYAAYHGLGALPQARQGASPGGEDLAGWAQTWYRWVSAAFLASYLDATRSAAFLPRGREELGKLIAIFLLEKAAYELGYEIAHRPAWVRLPLLGIGEAVEAVS